MKYEKLNIEITNEHYFDNIIEYNDCIELYSNGGVLKFRVYRNSKVYVCTDSKVDACNSSKVDAYDSSTVYAYENSKVYAKDISEVYAYENSTVYAEDRSTVFASNNSKVYAKDRSTVYAYDNSTVYAEDNSTVYATASSTVTAYEFSVIYIYNPKIKIKTENHFGTIIKQVFKLKQDIFVYKKLQDNKIVTLKLVKGQTFQSECFHKCRTDKAFVVSIDNIAKTKNYTSGISTYDNNFVYEVGKEVIADKYDKKIEECSNGIHFFLTREKAEKYTPL